MLKKINAKVLGVTVLFAAGLYIFTTFFCTGSCYVGLETMYLRPLFFGTLSLIPTLAFLLFFSTEIFVSWMKHVAWWVLLVAIYFVAEVNPYSSGILSIDRSQVALFWMAVLFVITVIYALIMNRKLKGSS